MLYTIDGDPYHLYKKSSGLLTQKQRKAFFSITLENIFDGHVILRNIPIQLLVTFYLPYEKLIKHRTGFMHPYKMPPLLPLVEFLSKSLTDIAYDNENQVASIIATKLYSKNPRTEIRLSELKNEE